MNKHSFKEWLIAVRPWSFPASAMPVIVTLGYLFWSGADVNWVNGIWALLNIIVFHAAGNTWSDYFDYRTGVDAADTFGVHTLTEGQFTPREIYRLAVGLLIAALAGGLGLLWRSGWPLLYIGLLGALFTVAYPSLKYRAWGDAVIFVTYAILPTLGTSYVAAGYWEWNVLWIALPVGLITVAILHANNTRDIQTDRRAHIRTLAMLLGGRTSILLYCFEILFPFFWVPVCALTGLFPWWSVLILPALLPAIGNVRMAQRFEMESAAGIARLDEQTAKLQMLFSLLFALSFLLAACVS